MDRQHTNPGEVLAEEFMKPLGLSARALGAAIGVPGNACRTSCAGSATCRRIPRFALAAILGRTRVSGSIFKLGTISRRLRGSTIILGSRHGLPRSKEGGHQLGPFHNNPRRYEPISASLAGGLGAREGGSRYLEKTFFENSKPKAANLRIGTNKSGTIKPVPVFAIRLRKCGASPKRIQIVNRPQEF